MTFLAWFKAWDYRPLVRLTVWLALAVHYSEITGADVAHIMKELILLCLLTFGLMTRVISLVVCGSLRLALALDDAAYKLAERLTAPLTRSKPFAVGFLAAFSAELTLAAGGAAFWRWAGVSARVVMMAEAALTAAARALTS